MDPRLPLSNASISAHGQAITPRAIIDDTIGTAALAEDAIAPRRIPAIETEARQAIRDRGFGRTRVPGARERHADAAIASFEAGDWPFDAEWRQWHPDPSWTIPTLAGLDELGQE